MDKQAAVDVEEVTIDMEDEPEKKGEEHFKIVNTVRSRHNRVQRMQHPVHARLKQHIGGEHRVLRGRPLVLSASTIEKHIEDIGEKARMGLIEVQTMDGRTLDPESLRKRPPRSADAPPPLPPPAVPHKLPDSAARDKNIGIGENIPQMPGGIPMAQVTAGNTTSGGIPGPLENEGKNPPADPAAGEHDDDDPAAG